jgi:hypothetical protein
MWTWIYNHAEMIAICLLLVGGIDYGITVMGYISTIGICCGIIGYKFAKEECPSQKQ